MAARLGAVTVKTKWPLQNAVCHFQRNSFHTSPVCTSVQSGKTKISIKGDKPVTYERSFSPIHISQRKSWNTWNTSTLKGGLRAPETAVEDMFIRKFIEGTFPGLVWSDIIIKRQHNIIRIAFLLGAKLTPQKVGFLIGYTEEMLSYWLQCIMKLEVQVVPDFKMTTFKYI